MWLASYMLFFSQWNPFLDGIQSPLVSSKLQSCLEESWPVILQAIALDAVPVNVEENEYSKSTDETTSRNCLLSGHSMAQLESEDYQFLWGFALLVLFQGQNSNLSGLKNSFSFVKAYNGGDPSSEELSSSGVKLHEIVLPVFQFLSTKRFASAGFLTMDICNELLQVAIHISSSCSCCEKFKSMHGNSLKSHIFCIILSFS